MLKCTVIITGASKGFGRAVAKVYANNCVDNLHFVLSARNFEELNETKLEILQIRSKLKLATTCDIVVGDIASSDKLEKLADDLFRSTTEREHEGIQSSVTFVNNAGSLGPLKPVGSTSTSLADIITAINLNVTGCIYLTSEFVRRVEQSAEFNRYPRAAVVNVSSLAAVQGFPSWGLYCAGKAARDMFHTVLADEQRSKVLAAQVQNTNGASVVSSEILVLNYAPGPMDTNMQAEIRTLEQSDPSNGTTYTDMKAQNQLVDPLASAEKLYALLNMPNSFRSGSHVDFYDITALK